MALGPRELTVMHRRLQLALRKTTVAQMEKIWPALDWADLDNSFPSFAASVLALVSKNRKTSAGLSAAYLRAFRVASGHSGDLSIVVPQMPLDQFTTSLRVTSMVAAKSAAAAGVPADVSMANALTQTQGSVARLVLSAGRETTFATVRDDPMAFGYQRVLGGKGCEFCRMLAGRGAVYKFDTAGFDAHDHCGCTSEPVYSSQPVNPPSDWVPPKSRPKAPLVTDIDATRTTSELRITLAQLEKSLEKFSSPGTRRRVEELRRKIADRD